MSAATTAGSRGADWARFVATLGTYGIVTFVLAGALVSLLPGQATAILVGWILAGFVAGQLLKRRYLG